jgi:hypothetical protein
VTNLKLKESPIRSFADLLNWIFEYLVFFKWIYFKNRPRGNFLFLRSIMVTTFFGFIYYTLFSSLELLIMGVDIDPIIILALVVTIGYWNMTYVFQRKSVDVTNLYNQYLIELGQGHKQSADLLLNSLSMQVLAVDLWAHRSFTDIFVKALNLAIKDDNGSDDWSNKLESNKMSVREARELLQNRQNKLIQGLSA